MAPEGLPFQPLVDQVGESAHRLVHLVGEGEYVAKTFKSDISNSFSSVKEIVQSVQEEQAFKAETRSLLADLGTSENFIPYTQYVIYRTPDGALTYAHVQKAIQQAQPLADA